MATEQVQGASAATETEFAPSDFAALLRKEFKPSDDSRANRIEQAVSTLAQQALADAGVIGDDVFSTMDALRAALDRKLTEQVNQIIHHADFQGLESAWRGLNYMVMNTSTSSSLKIRVLNVGKDECRKMFRQYRDAAWDQSPLFKKVYESWRGFRNNQVDWFKVAEYHFDIFMNQLERTKPGFTTFFTNQVASSMHRFWAASFPEEYARRLVVLQKSSVKLVTMRGVAMISQEAKVSQSRTNTTPFEIYDFERYTVEGMVGTKVQNAAQNFIIDVA
jgi:predicted component of type VI protein secretion system